MHACMHFYVEMIYDYDLVFAIDFGKANLGGVLESTIGFSEAVKRSHYSLKMVQFYGFDEGKRRNKEKKNEGFACFVLRLFYLWEGYVGTLNCSDENFCRIGWLNFQE